MKKWLFLNLIFQSTLVFAGGVTIGNGGDITDSDKMSLTEIETLARKTAKSLNYVFNSLDLLATDPQEKFPAYYHKLFLESGKLIDVAGLAKLVVNSQDACYQDDGTAKDGSAESKSNSICISAFRLQNKILRQEAYFKLGGLLAHELSHLSGASEDEAVDFQKRIEVLLERTSLEQANNFDFINKGRIDFIRFLYATSISDQVKNKNWQAACKDITSADEQFQNLLPKIGLFSFYSSKSYGVSVANYIHHKLSQMYICEKIGQPADEMESAAIELIFDNKKQVFLDEVSSDPLILLGAIYSVKGTHLPLSMIEDDAALEKTINSLKSAF